MNTDAVSAVVFALLAVVFGWRYFGSGLEADGFGLGQRRLILGTGTAIIVLCLLYYLNLI
ncbi:MAG: hypothetical protein Q4G28_08780 [Neisseria sp.]|nr:hypothetical protein [Neisseria sp.]